MKSFKISFQFSTNLLELDQRLSASYEYFGFPVYDIILEPQIRQNRIRSILVTSTTRVWPRTLAEHFVTTNETLVGHSVCESSTANTDIF